MPYGISNNQDGCAGWAAVKQESDGSYTTVKCYVSKQDAIDRMVAQSIAEKLYPLGEVGKRNSQAGRFVICDIDDTLLSSGVRPMQKNIDALNFMADDFNIVLVTGRIESQREATAEALKNAGIKYDRLVMKQDAKQDTVEYKKDAAERLRIAKPVNVAIDNDENAREAYSSLGIHTISPSELKEPRHMTPVGACIVEAVMTDQRDIPMTSDAPSVDVAPELVEVRDAVEAETIPEVVVDEVRLSNPHWAIRSTDDKRSYAYTNLEVRASEDGKTLVGYASMWDTPSEPMPFTEYVKRGAFTKTLKDGADVRLLIDHEGVPLARTKSGTLKLAEDDRGLRVEASLDSLNPDAARVISAMKRGDLSQMSFAFRTIKDSWSADRMTRELREVQLFDVSIVTFPAYEQTVAELRSKKDAVTVAPTTGVLLRRSQIELQKYRSR